MSEHCDTGGLGGFGRWLSLWGALAIAAGPILGAGLPGLFGGLTAPEPARVNLPVAVLIWAMIFPMMVGVDSAAVAEVVGVLVEVPVMLSLVAVARRTRGWFAE
jgi:arsenite transporter